MPSGNPALEQKDRWTDHEAEKYLQEKGDKNSYLTYVGGDRKCKKLALLKLLHNLAIVRFAKWIFGNGVFFLNTYKIVYFLIF
jgi:hypothetical protein